MEIGCETEAERILRRGLIGGRSKPRPGSERPPHKMKAQLREQPGLQAREGGVCDLYLPEYCVIPPPEWPMNTLSVFGLTLKLRTSS